MQAYVLAASVQLGAGADPGAPGAAVTSELCGHWEHRGGCAWPHHTSTSPGPDGLLDVRVIYAVEPAEEPAIRARIVRALRTGRLDGPSGVVSWALLDAGPSRVRAHERPLAARLGGRGPDR